MPEPNSETDLKYTLQQMDEYDFEHLIADLWQIQGWETEVSTKSSDRGLDIIATKDEGGFETSAVIQAKRYQEGNTVGSPAIQQYASLRRQEDADLALVVTTSSYSKQAEQLAEELNLKLIDGDGLSELIEQNSAMNLLEEYNSIDPQTNSPTQDHKWNYQANSKLPAWWEYGATPGKAGGSWWKGILFFSALFFLFPILAAFISVDSWAGLIPGMVVLLSWVFLPIFLLIDIVILRVRQIWKPYWWAYLIGAVFLGPLVGFTYLYRRHKEIRVP